jgi:urea carboxylase
MGNPVIVVESMKMEFSVEAPVSGTVRQLFCKEGSHVSAGQMLLIVQEEGI